MTLTPEQAQRDFQLMMSMAGPETRKKLEIIQNYLDDSDIDFSTTNGSKVFTVMSKSAKQPLAKLLAGEPLSDLDKMKIQAAAQIGSKQNFGGTSYYKELNQVKLSKAREDSVIAGQDLPQDVRQYATQMYMDAKKDPKRIPDFLDFAAQIIDKNSPLRGSFEILDEKDSIANNPMEQIIAESDLSEAQKAHAFTLLHAAAEDPSKQGTFTQYMDALAPVAIDSKPRQIFSKPGYINSLGAPRQADVRGPLVLSNPTFPVKPAVMSSQLRAHLSKPKPAHQTTTPKKLKRFSRLVPASLVAAAAAACITVGIMASSLLFGNGTNNDIAGVDTDVQITATAAPEVTTTTLQKPSEEDAIVTTEVVDAIPTQTASLGGYELLTSLFANSEADSDLMLPASYVQPLTGTPIVNSADIADDVVQASFEERLIDEQQTFDINPSLVPSDVGFMTEIVGAAVPQSIMQEFEIESGAVPEFPPFQTASIDNNLVPEFPPFQTASIDNNLVPEFPSQSSEDDSLDLEQAATPIDTTHAEVEADQSTTHASMNDFADGISGLFNGNVPDELSAHINQIGEGQTVVNDAIHVYETIKDLSNYAQGTAVHAFAVQNLEMIANGNYGPISITAQNDLMATEWLPKQYGALSEAQLAEKRPMPRPQRG
jgi:hypothetical protein